MGTIISYCIVLPDVSTIKQQYQIMFENQKISKTVKVYYIFVINRTTCCISQCNNKTRNIKGKISHKAYLILHIPSLKCKVYVYYIPINFDSISDVGKRQKDGSLQACPTVHHNVTAIDSVDRETNFRLSWLHVAAHVGQLQQYYLCYFGHLWQLPISLLLPSVLYSMDPYHLDTLECIYW